MLRRRHTEEYRGHAIICTKWLWGRWYVTVTRCGRRVRYGAALSLHHAVTLGHECVDGGYALMGKARTS